MIRTLAYEGDTHIGIFTRVLEDIAVVPPEASADYCAALKEALDVTLVKTLVQGSSIIGSLVSGNSRGAIVSGLALPDEIRAIEEYREVMLLEGSMNAAGNVILANDQMAAVHPEMDNATMEQIHSVLGVPVIRLTLSGIKTVGMAGYATNRGILVHARSAGRELATLESTTDLPVGTGTINMGSGLVGTGLLANSKGYLAGIATSGFEIGRIADVFGFVEG
jgi:translation initiation factor 6